MVCILGTRSPTLKAHGTGIMEVAAVHGGNWIVGTLGEGTLKVNAQITLKKKRRQKITTAEPMINALTGKQR